MEREIKAGDYILIKENANFKIFDGTKEIGVIGVRKGVSYIISEVKPEGYVTISYRTYRLDLAPTYWEFQAPGGDI